MGPGYPSGCRFFKWVTVLVKRVPVLIKRVLVLFKWDQVLTSDLEVGPVFKRPGTQSQLLILPKIVSLLTTVLFHFYSKTQKTSTLVTLPKSRRQMKHILNMLCWKLEVLLENVLPNWKMVPSMKWFLLTLFS